MSMPQGQQPSAVTITQQPYSTRSSHGSVGPVIAVVVVIMILGVLAGMIGRLCSGKRIMGHGQFDIQSWAERKFSSCIDGTISPSPPLQPHLTDTSFSTPTPTHQETGQEEQEPSSSNPS